jgi:hypothetical protein
MGASPNTHGALASLIWRMENMEDADRKPNDKIKSEP